VYTAQDSNLELGVDILAPLSLNLAPWVVCVMFSEKVVNVPTIEIGFEVRLGKFPILFKRSGADDFDNIHNRDSNAFGVDITHP